MKKLQQISIYDIIIGINDFSIFLLLNGFLKKIKIVEHSTNTATISIEVIRFSSIPVFINRRAIILTPIG